MSRHLLNPGELAHPTDPVTTAPAVVTQPQATPATAVAQPTPAAEPAPQETVTFVKNLHPGEKIRFADGSTFKWPSQVYVSSNPEEIAKIREVATKHHIVEKE